MRPYSPIPQCLQPIFHFQISPANNAYPRNAPGKTFQLGGPLTALLKNSDNIQPLLLQESLILSVVLRIVFFTEFARRPGGVGHFADCSTFPSNPPKIFHPSLFAEVPSLILRAAPEAIRFVWDR